MKISKNRVFFCGGSDQTQDFNDSYILDLKEKMWKKIDDKFNMKLKTSGGSQIGFSNNKVVSFGGWNG